MESILWMQRDGRGRSRTACIAVAAIILAAALIAFFWKGSDSCGNGICRVEKGENCRGCPLDCGSCSVAGICGDGLCTGEEDSVKCPGDCRPSAECGDGKCDAGVGEDCAACASDCGECSLEHGCGDGRCDSRETFLSCPADCNDICGNGICGPDENCWDCPQDCKCSVGEYCLAGEKRCVKPTCGNRRCEIFENSANCCVDCPCEINYTKCNPETESCEAPSMSIGDEDIQRIVAGYYSKKSMQAEAVTPQEVFMWGGVVGRKTEVKLAGQETLKFVLVTDSGDVIELPLF